MKVVKWIFFDDVSEDADEIGALGGWFNASFSGNAGQRWKDYLDYWKSAAHPYIEALREAVLENQLWVDGNWHQRNEHGVPVFEDGKVGLFSMRAWGDLMAAIWSEYYDRDYCYLDFYCDVAARPTEDLEFSDGTIIRVHKQRS